MLDHKRNLTLCLTLSILENVRVSKCQDLCQLVVPDAQKDNIPYC